MAKSAVKTVAKAKAPAPEPEVEAEDEGIDVDSLDMAGIEALVENYGVEVPDNWGKLKLAARKQWLKEKFAATDDDEADETDAADADDADEAEADAPDADDDEDATDEADGADDDSPSPATVAKSPLKGKITTVAAAPASKGKTVVKSAAKADVAVTAKPKLSDKLGKAKAAAVEAVEEDEEEVPAPKGKGLTVVNKAKTVKAEVLDPDDLIVDVGTTVENLDKEEALAMMGDLIGGADFAWFKLGGVMTRVLEQKWFEPYATFGQYVQEEHGIAPRTATYWMNIYNTLVKLGIPYKKIEPIGWAKLKELIKVLTPENCDKMIKLSNKNSVPQIVEIVKKMVKAEGDPAALEAATGSGASAIHTKAFKLHDDQLELVNSALDKAKAEGNTDVDAVALGYICIGYVNSTAKGGKKINDATVKSFLGTLDVSAACQLLADAFPDETINISIGDEPDADATEEGDTSDEE